MITFHQESVRLISIYLIFEEKNGKKISWYKKNALSLTKKHRGLHDTGSNLFLHMSLH